MFDQSLRRHLGAILGSVFLITAATAAQARPQTPPVNLEGVWRIASPTARLVPVDGPVPFTAEGRARFAENERFKSRGEYDEYDITTSRCSNPGVPRLMLTPLRFKIWQRQGVVTFDFEWNRAIRQIDMRGVPTEPALVPFMTGVSKGRWEGETLVALTTDISDRTLLDELTPHTDALRVTERMRLVDANTLENRITIEDPAYFTRPWDAVVRYSRQPQALFPEDVCLDRLPVRQPAQN